MSCCDLTLTVQEEEPITLEIVEATIKPEQDKTVTPTYSEQTVLPDAGMTLGSVTVEPIPEPTERLSITENGSYDVARIGTADVDVLPTLQTRTVEPKEYGQTIRADHYYDGLEQVDVLRIPEWYIIPQGSLDITANGDGIDVREKATVNVAVPLPVMPDEYAIGGSLADDTATGYYIKRGATKIRTSMFEDSQSLSSVDIPDSVEEIGNLAFRNLPNDINIKLPASLKRIGSNAFQNSRKLTLVDGLPAGVVEIGPSAFTNCSMVDFDRIPDSVTSIGAYAFFGCKAMKLMSLSESLTVIPNNCFTESGVIFEEIPSSILDIGAYAFFNCKSLTKITFKGTPNTIAANAFADGSAHGSYVTDIYVPWSEGAVANAPWGAKNATIHYNWEG